MDPGENDAVTGKTVAGACFALVFIGIAIGMFLFRIMLNTGYANVVGVPHCM